MTRRTSPKALLATLFDRVHEVNASAGRLPAEGVVDRAAGARRRARGDRDLVRARPRHARDRLDPRHPRRLPADHAARLPRDRPAVRSTRCARPGARRRSRSSSSWTCCGRSAMDLLDASPRARRRRAARRRAASCARSSAARISTSRLSDACGANNVIARDGRRARFADRPERSERPRGESTDVVAGSEMKRGANVSLTREVPGPQGARGRREAGTPGRRRRWRTT